MKRTLTILVLVIMFFASSFAQERETSSKYGWLAKDSYSIGFGFGYPKYISTSWAQYKEGGSAFWFTLQKNYSEHIALRGEAFYTYVRGFYGPDDDAHMTIVGNDVVGLNLDLMYYFVPCEPISPFVSFGFGGYWHKFRNEPDPKLDKSFIDYSFNASIGSEWRIGENWKLKTELHYYTSGSSKFDGAYGTSNGGILGGIQDSWVRLDLGFNYYFSYGEKSHLCDLYEGLGQVDYAKIEEIVKKYQTEPTVIDYGRIEDIVKKNKPATTPTGNVEPSNWVLVGVNFETGSAKLKSESMPILYNAAQILLTNPDVKVEIQGHTDNVGSERFNQQLSLKRAEAVKNFLIAKGVSADRMTTVGLGKTKPIMDNKTAQGRELNRRIEFKVLNK